MANWLTKLTGVQHWQPETGSDVFLFDPDYSGDVLVLFRRWDDNRKDFDEKVFFHRTQETNVPVALESTKIWVESNWETLKTFKNQIAENIEPEKPKVPSLFSMMLGDLEHKVTEEDRVKFDNFMDNGIMTDDERKQTWLQPYLRRIEVLSQELETDRNQYERVMQKDNTIMAKTHNTSSVERIEIRQPQTGVNLQPKTNIQAGSAIPGVGKSGLNPVPPKMSAMTGTMNTSTASPMQKMEPQPATYNSDKLSKAHNLVKMYKALKKNAPVMPTPGNPLTKAEKSAKEESCIMDVKSSNEDKGIPAEGTESGKGNPWAICHAALKKGLAQEVQPVTNNIKTIPFERLQKLRKMMPVFMRD